MFLYGVIVPVLPFLLEDQITVPHSQVQGYVSVLLAAYAGASVLFSLPAGWIADRTRSRRGPFLSGLLALTAATLLIFLGRSVALLIVARVLQGMSGAVVWTVGLAMIVDTVGAAHLGKAVGTILSVVSVGELLAPVLGGIVYTKAGGLAGIFGLSVSMLAVDFLMRLLVVEKKDARRWENRQKNDQCNIVNGSNATDDACNNNSTGAHHENVAGRVSEEEEEEEEEVQNEESPLLSNKAENDFYSIPSGQSMLIRNVPILYCLKSPRLLTAFFLAFIYAFMLGAFDATIPTEASELFGFTSLKAGLLFIAIDVPYLVTGPLAGWAVDRYGPKPTAVFGFAFLVPTLVLLRIPHPVTGTERPQPQIIIFCALLALCGVGMGAIGAPCIVEASDVVTKFDRANRLDAKKDADNDDSADNSNENYAGLVNGNNDRSEGMDNEDDNVESDDDKQSTNDQPSPSIFGRNGPYAQLYGLNSLVFSAGLTVGPLLAGILRDRIGYGNMNVVVAILSGITAILSYFIIGGPAPGISRFVG